MACLSPYPQRLAIPLKKRPPAVRELWSETSAAEEGKGGPKKELPREQAARNCARSSGQSASRDEAQSGVVVEVTEKAAKDNVLPPTEFVHGRGSELWVGGEHRNTLGAHT